MAAPRDRRDRTDSPLWKRPVAEEVHDELDHHLELLARDFENRGHSPAEARRLAAAKFGDRDRLERACRELATGRERRWRLRTGLSELATDVVCAARQVRRNPGFSLAVILGMAFGLAINIAVFGWVYKLLFEPLPFESSERIVTLWEAQPQRANPKNVVGPATFMVWRDEAASFERLGGFITVSTNLAGEGPPVRAQARLVTDGYFEVLGVEPVLGRLLEARDASEERAAVVLSHRFWMSRFGGRRDVLGQSIELNGHGNEIVGVLPPGAALDMGPGYRPNGDAPDLYRPLPVTEQWRLSGGRWLMVVAKLKRGTTPATAVAELGALARQLEEEGSDFHAGWTFNLVPLAEHLRESARLPALSLFVAVGLVLALMAVNMASLMVARMSSRAGEVAVRTALGAGRLRLVRQITLEGVAITVAATGVGVLLGAVLLRAGAQLLPPDLATADLPTLGLPVMLFTAALAALAALVIGVWPALLVTRRPGRQLRAGRHGGRGRLRAGLVAAEIALAAILLVGAGLMLRSMWSLLNVDPGFEIGNTMGFSVQLPRGTEASDQFEFFDRLMERLATLPGVESVGAVSHIPMAGAGAATTYFPIDRPEPDSGTEPVADIRVLRGDYLGTLGIAVVEGRGFDSRDQPGAEQGVVLIDRTVAEEHWPNSTAIGKEVFVYWGKGGPRRIVGVVAATHVAGLDVVPRGAIYFPHGQEPSSVMSIVMRTAGGARPWDAVRSVVRELDPGLPIYADQSVRQVVADSLGQRRFLARSLGLFAAGALLVAALGIYGMTSFSVLQRTREIGLRMALGASPKTIATQVVGQVGRLTLLALVVGLGASALLTRWVESLLHGVRPFDPLTLLGVAAVLGASALAAAARPAIRAASLPPVRALRE